jgi:hypothetical protein
MEARLVYWIFPILFVGSMALMLLAARSATRRATRNLRIFADRLGLTLIEYPPVLGYFPRTPTVEGTPAGQAGPAVYVHHWQWQVAQDLDGHRCAGPRALAQFFATAAGTGHAYP